MHNAAEDSFIPCTVRQLPDDMQVAAAREACRQNPDNAPEAAARLASAGILAAFQPEAEDWAILPPQRLALLTSRKWGKGGVTLSVSFMERQPDDLKRRIVEHLNAWNAQGANVKFALTGGTGQIRISLGRGGYWCYAGTDCLQISPREQTMNLEGFTMRTPEAEFRRVVRHEAGHALGFMHEHMRQQLVARLDERKTIAYFRQTQGWSEREVREQVLTPLADRLLTATPEADQDSIMCYQLPGSITVDGQPIRGGNDINAADYGFIAKVYPSVAPPPPPVEPPPLPTEAEVEIVARGLVSLKVNGKVVSL